VSLVVVVVVDGDEPWCELPIAIPTPTAAIITTTARTIAAILRVVPYFDPGLCVAATMSSDQELPRLKPPIEILLPLLSVWFGRYCAIALVIHESSPPSATTDSPG
jgi:hypothetical protein